MEREGLALPLLIGGATTSAKHTAVKIAPAYHETVIHVKDASRCVGVVERLTNPAKKNDLDRDNRAAQQKERDSYNRKRQRKLVSYSEALKRRFSPVWNGTAPPTPAFLGTRVLRDFPLAEIVPFIDWSPFFMAWELTGKYPAIFEDKNSGKEARKLFDDAQSLLDRIVREKLLTARAVYGFFPANSDADDIVIYADATRSQEKARLHMLRQQWEREGQKEFRSLSDYVAPLGSGLDDTVG